MRCGDAARRRQASDRVGAAWLARAAKGGHAAAQFDLGRLWADGSALTCAWSHFCLSHPWNRFRRHGASPRRRALTAQGEGWR